MTAGDGISRSSARREADMADMARAVEPVQAGQAEAPGGDHQIRIPRGQTLALCCSGGGIRSATFNLGVIQALQSAEVFGAVRTVTAVSGGSYLAAAHALVTANPAGPGSGQPAGGPAAAGRPAAVGEPLSPAAYALWAEAVGSLHLDARWLYVTDGGHYENLGMVEALRRRPDHLIVVDAAGEPPGMFSILGQAIALARSELRVQVTIDPAPDLTPDPASGLCENAYATGTFRYPEEGTAAGPHHLVYLKLAVPKGAPLDVIAYRQGHPAFPTDSTLQQLYDDQEFEAYRELGYHCAQAAVADICYQRPGPPGTPSRPSPAAAGEIRPPAT